MEINISEDTRVKHGRTGKYKYTAFAVWNPSGWWIVDLIVSTSTGRVVDSMTRAADAPSALVAIRWTLDEYEAEAA